MEKELKKLQKEFSEATRVMDHNFHVISLILEKSKAETRNLRLVVFALIVGFTVVVLNVAPM